MTEHSSVNKPWDRAAIELQLGRMLAETSPIGVDEIDGSLKLVDLGLSSLALQIYTAQVEAVFEITLDDMTLATIENFEQLVDAVEQRRRGS